MSEGLRSQVKSAPISITASGDNTVIVAVAGKLITVVSMLLVNSAATANSVTVKDGANLLSGAMLLGIAPAAPLFIPDSGSSGYDLFQTTNGSNNFILNLSAATLVTGVIWYIQN